MATKAKSKALRRSAKPVNVWRRPAPAVRLGDERMRFTAIRKGQQDEVRLNDVCTSIRWDDVTMELTGSIDMIAPAGRLKLADGDKVRAEFASSDRASFNKLWTMALGGNDSGITKGIQDDSRAAELGSTLSVFRGSKMDFSYRKDKAHPQGWTCDQIARDVGRRTGMPLGKLARGTHRIRSLVRRDADPVDVLVLAYKQERQNTGRRFVAAWDGRMNITRLQPSGLLVQLLPVLLDGTYTTRRRPDFATVLNVRTTVKHGKRKARKIRVRVADMDGVRRLGVVTRTVHPENIDTEAEARTWARRSLRTRMTPFRELTVTVPLMPGLRRGHALRIRWPDEGLDQVLFVRSASHEWTPGGGTSTITVRFDDPFADERAKRDADKKAATARKRNRPTPKSAVGADSDRRKTVQPKNRKRRGDH